MQKRTESTFAFSVHVAVISKILSDLSVLARFSNYLDRRIIAKKKVRLEYCGVRSSLLSMLMVANHIEIF